MTRPLAWTIGLQLALMLLCSPARADDVRDLYFGEALFQAGQGKYFEALERLDAELGQHYGLDEPELDTLHHHIREAEFFVGDFELNYRMHHRAGRAISAVLNGDVDQSVRNEAAYRLARIHFQKAQMADALEALARIEGSMPARVRDDVEFLRANVYLAVGRSAEAAEVLRELQGTKGLTGFSEFNLAVALLQDGRTAEALQQLDRAGQVDARDAMTHSIRDKANLVLGGMLLESGRFEEARAPLERVRLEGPMSNEALLGAGWAELSGENFERAVVPWSILADRDPTDAAVQEAKLALPYAYSRLNVHGRAAVLYGKALDTFGRELNKLDASMGSIENGSFLEALVREEIHQDKDWVVRMRSLPETPETFYLVELLASHDFQTALQNYLDLEDLRKKLATWQASFDAFDSVIAARADYFEPLLPEVDQTFRELDSRFRVRVEQYELLVKRMQDLLVMPRPEFLATTEEKVLSTGLTAMDEALGGVGRDGNDEIRQRIRRLEGIITWTLHTQYDDRLTRFYENLQDMQGSVALLKEHYQAFVRTRQAATLSYQGYDAPIKRLRGRIHQASAKVDQLMARQGRMLEQVAMAELESRQRRLVNYQHQARYALADSYDRATQAQYAEEP